ncbi:energy transducer TonB family protein [Rhodohalobacter sulfatireducens]|uniref:Energy transducer TonB n=1 Tax=Rhodohalobacter sulfatireducens TaxID=2911366 RepID=A0ABS9KCQ2_9BACT|nr:energy transducer TonB [Rhodohalobacter sulfatireducens]MCG2588593.1 energy transducer TonB [Rhodohalobacter sulfatireducens]MDR9363864.1 energy transducer TonB [Balneolaceae bacterium]MDR9407241.1 energy transducer TonB [Balneolaceae bacterium]
MLEWIKSHIDEEDRFGVGITAAIHIVILIIAILYTIEPDMNRAAFMEVTLGEFRSGTLAQQSEVQNEQVATRPNPSEVEPEEVDPEITQPAETPQNPVEETTKPVDLPDQEEEIPEEETVETPETDVINPENEEETEEVVEEVVPPQTQEDEQIEEGVEDSGDERGISGDPNVDQGPGNTPDKSAPYDLQWEGELNRTPMVQPLPNNQTNEEAVITIRFEVHPDGSLGRVIPLKKMNPELEREVMRTLRSWRFSRLPSGVPQEPQWGTITFRFVLE